MEEEAVMNVQMNLSRNLKDKPADESKLGFGHIFTDHMLMINYTDGKGWHDARIVPYGNLSLDPACQVCTMARRFSRASSATARRRAASTSSVPAPILSASPVAPSAWAWRPCLWRMAWKR